ncbi:MAG: hypothetical protein GKR77_01490 [Legionellales bacterium]|nr:hypothetical protein [Legionellales bacterium]
MSLRQKFDFSHAKIDDAKVILIANKLKTNKDKTQQIAFFEGNQISGVGLAAILRAINENENENSQVYAILFARNKITSGGTSEIAEAFKENTKVKYLDISSNRIEDEHLGIIFYTGNQLKSLVISNNQISGVGSATILRAGNQLEYLNLSNNRIGDTGLDQIADELIGNTVLKMLYLAGNQISGVGSKSILRVGNQLEYLDLSNNRIGDTGLDQIADGLRENTVLKTLDLKGNQISVVGLLIILRAINENENSQVHTILFAGNNITNQDIPEITEVSKESTTLKCLELGISDSEDDKKIDETHQTESFASQPLNICEEFETKYSAYSDITFNKEQPVSFLCELLERIYIKRKSGGSSNIFDSFNFLSKFANIRKHHTSAVECFLARNKRESFADLSEAFIFIREEIKSDLNPKGTLADILHYCACKCEEEGLFEDFSGDSSQGNYQLPKALNGIN